MKMIKFDTRLKPETIERIKYEAEKDGRSACGMARKILEDYMYNLDKNSSENKKFVDRHAPEIKPTKDMTEFFNERNKNK